MSQYFSKFVGFVTKGEWVSPVAHREVLPIRVASPSLSESNRRRQAFSGAGRHDWRVTSFSSY